jgi:hypothetical protein
VVVSARELTVDRPSKVASVVLARCGCVGLVLFAQAYLWGARIAIERHGDVWVAVGLVSLAALDGVALGLAVYRSAVVRGSSNRRCARRPTTPARPRWLHDLRSPGERTCTASRRRVLRFEPTRVFASDQA